MKAQHKEQCAAKRDASQLSLIPVTSALLGQTSCCAASSCLGPWSISNAHNVGALIAVLAAEQQQAAEKLAALHQDADQALAERPEVQDLEEVGTCTSLTCITG